MCLSGITIYRITAKDRATVRCADQDQLFLSPYDITLLNGLLPGPFLSR